MLWDIIGKIVEDYSLLVLIINIFILCVSCILLITFNYNRKRWDKLNDYMGNVAKTVESVRYGDLTKKLETIEDVDAENLTESLNRLIETLHDRESMVREYQAELGKQNKLLEGVLNSLSDGLIIIDEQENILRATHNIAEWFNQDGTKLVGHSLRNYIETEKNKPYRLLKREEVLVPSDKGSNYEASAVELKNEEHKNLYVVILKNITDQKELETLKEDFVATLTHDLKVPIIAENNMIELFLGGSFGKISEKQSLALKNMQSSSKELLELVQTVLDTYKLRDGKISLYKENILLKNFIGEILEEMYPIAQKTKNEFRFILDRDIRVFADRFQLKRVVKNLIQNAISYGEPKSSIDITIGEIPDFVIIKVKDKGAGISKSDIDKIFNRYYSASRKFKKIGTGLGLYLSLQILRAHKGDLTVESVEGEYTEFCIKIPAQDYERRFM